MAGQKGRQRQLHVSFRKEEITLSKGGTLTNIPGFKKPLLHCLTSAPRPAYRVTPDPCRRWRRCQQRQQTPVKTPAASGTGFLTFEEGPPGAAVSPRRSRLQLSNQHLLRDAIMRVLSRPHFLGDLYFRPPSHHEKKTVLSSLSLSPPLHAQAQFFCALKYLIFTAPDIMSKKKLDMSSMAMS